MYGSITNVCNKSMYIYIYMYVCIYIYLSIYVHVHPDKDRLSVNPTPPAVYLIINLPYIIHQPCGLNVLPEPP